jgi:hypothetical protein
VIGATALTGKTYSAKLASTDLNPEFKETSMGETSKTGGEKASASTALPGRKLATSKTPRMLKPFEIDLLRQDLKAALARLREARSR